MENHQIHARKSEKGFTLVELAIVMIIIGLLITGVLKGQEMIANAQVTSTVSQIKGLDAAVSSFRDMYQAFPGDMVTASTRLNNCAADPCNNGDGNGRINLTVGTTPGLNDEGAYFFNHLRAADLITGLDGTATLAFGSALVAAPVGGGYLVGHTGSGAPVGFTAAELRAGHYLVLNGAAANVAATSGVLSNSQAARVDRKLDDGNPTTGVVISQSAACRLAGPPVSYDEANAGGTCAIAIRIQG